MGELLNGRRQVLYLSWEAKTKTTTKGQGKVKLQRGSWGTKSSPIGCSAKPQAPKHFVVWERKVGLWDQGCFFISIFGYAQNM